MLAPLPRALGGLGWGCEPDGAASLLSVLRLLGRASLAVARLYEGHVNALKLICVYGTGPQQSRAMRDAQDGHLFGIWVTEGPEPLCLRDEAQGLVLSGEKRFASGALHVTRPLVTASGRAGEPRMVLVELGPERSARDTLGGVHGMRAARTGVCDFTGTVVSPDALIGEPGDYLRQPEFSAGAWRGAAAALGGLDHLVELLTAQLRARGRHRHPHQLARIGEALIAREGAAFWAERAAHIAEADVFAGGDVVATVGLARLAVEAAGLDIIRLVQRGLGLAAFLADNPAERVMRDLATYLRQPAPDETRDEAALWFAEAGHAPAELPALDVQQRFRTLPLRTDERLLRGGRAMILAPHADDESLGCGGLIAALCACDRPPLVVLVTDGCGSHPGSRDYPPERLRALREAEFRAAAGVLGLADEHLHLMRLADTQVPETGETFDAACAEIAEAARASGCDTLLAPWLHDPHGDHRAVQLMARAVAARVDLRLLSYPVWGWLLPAGSQPEPGQPMRGFRLDISAHLARKRQAIFMHRSQYGGLITDDPGAFSLPATLLEVFDQPFETYLETL